MLCGCEPLNISTIQPSTSIKAPLSTFDRLSNDGLEGMEGLSLRIMEWSNIVPE